MTATVIASLRGTRRRSHSVAPITVEREAIAPVVGLAMRPGDQAARRRRAMRLDRGMDNPHSAPDKPDAAAAGEKSRLARFIMRSHTFLSSFVIGAAGLIATSIWQYRQSETTANQAVAQQKVAETAAENSWKITRADTVSQRYGVLLSLTRAEIIDPELAVSYALELGKDNADDMTSVLASTRSKDYRRLARAYTLNCEERYGLLHPIEVGEDKSAPRWEAIVKLSAAAVQLALKGGEHGPMALFDNDRDVQVEVQQ